jgi:hypothetical protein
MRTRSIRTRARALSQSTFPVVTEAQRGGQKNLSFFEADILNLSAVPAMPAKSRTGVTTRYQFVGPRGRPKPHPRHAGREADTCSEGATLCVGESRDGACDHQAAFLTLPQTGTFASRTSSLADSRESAREERPVRGKGAVHSAPRSLHAAGRRRHVPQTPTAFRRKRLSARIGSTGRQISSASRGIGSAAHPSA